MSKKYDRFLAMKEPPEEMSIIELGVLGEKLGIDVDAIREKHLTALFEQLVKEVREAYRRRKCRSSL